MAAVLGDLLQIVDFQTLFNQQVLNVYYYRVVQVTGFSNPGYLSVLDVFRDDVVTPIQQMQHSQVKHTGLVIRNLSNGVDFAERTPLTNDNGAISTGDCMPPFVAWTFRLVRESLATRNGYKRIAGVPEVNWTGTALAGFTNQHTNVEAALAADIYLGAVLTCEPVIPKRPIPHPASQYVYSSIGAAQFRGVGSQNTRKIGRGS